MAGWLVGKWSHLLTFPKKTRNPLEHDSTTGTPGMAAFLKWSLFGSNLPKEMSKKTTETTVGSMLLVI